jgi:hypothetical protein
MTAACTFDIRAFQIIGADGAAGAAGQGGMGNARDASHETGDARAGADGASGQGGRADASIDGNAGAGGFGGAAGKSGAAGASGSGGAAGKAGSGGVGGSGGAAGSAGAGGSGGAAGSGGGGGAAGSGGSGGAAGASLGGAAGVAGIGGVAGLSGGGGAAARDGGTTGGTAGQAGGASGGSDGGTTVDANDAGAGGGGAADGGVVVFFEENFDSALGVFMVENQCGPSPPVWSNNAGYANATDPAVLGISSIYSPPVPVPTNVSEIRLRLSHKVGTELGYHGGQLLVAVNGKPPEVVKNFTVGPYVNGSNIFPDTCTARPEPTWIFDAWSGNLPEFESEANLSGAPFNVGAGSTVSIRFRMLTDKGDVGTGWDINWVRLMGRGQ